MEEVDSYESLVLTVARRVVQLPVGLCALAQTEQLSEYVLSHAWEQTHCVWAAFQLWEKPFFGSDKVRLQALVPRIASYVDYGLRVSELVETLAQHEERPAVDVLAEILGLAPDHSQGENDDPS